MKEIVNSKNKILIGVLLVLILSLGFALVVQAAANFSLDLVTVTIDVVDPGCWSSTSATGQVDIYGMGTYADDASVSLPPGSTISHRARASGLVGDYQTYVVPEGGGTLTEDRYSCVTLDVDPPECWDDVTNEATAQIDIYGQGNELAGDVLGVPTGVNLSRRARASGLVGLWLSEAIDAEEVTLTETRFSCVTLAVDPPECWGDVTNEATAQIDIYGQGNELAGEVLGVPTGISLSRAARASGLVGGWIGEVIDADEYTLTEDRFSCVTLAVDEPDCWTGVTTGAIAEIDIYGQGNALAGEVLGVPTGVSLSRRARASGRVGDWDDTYIVPEGSSTLTEARFSCVTLAVDPFPCCTDAQIDIFGQGNELAGEILGVPTGVSLSRAARANGRVGAWLVEAISAEQVTLTENRYDCMGIVLPGTVKVGIYGLGTFENGDQVCLPTSIDISWRLEFDGLICGWNLKHVDGLPLVVEPKATVDLPPELVSAGATVSIRYGPSGLGNGDEFDYVPGQNIQWKLTVNGFSSAWKSTSLGCDLTLHVSEDDYCHMEIQIPDEGLRSAGAQVAIRYSSFGWMSHGTKVYLPKDISIQWKLKVNGFESAYKTKPVDCTPVVVLPDDWCLMEIQIPDEGLRNAGAQVAIRYSSFGWMSHGTKVYLPKDISIQWKLKVNGFESAYKTKPVDCTPVVVLPDDWCLMTITMPLELADAGGQVAIRYSSFGWMSHGAQVYLPTSINIQWNIKVNGFSGGYTSKHVDCTPLDVPSDAYKELTFQFDWTTDSKNYKTQIRYGPSVVNGESVILPVDITIQVKPVVFGYSLGGYHIKEIDCTWDMLTWKLEAMLTMEP